MCRAQSRRQKYTGQGLTLPLNPTPVPPHCRRKRHQHGATSSLAGICAADHRNMEKALGCRRRGIFVESWHP